MIYSRLTVYQTLWIKWTSNFHKLMTLLWGAVECILTILSQCQNETYEQKMFRSNVQAFFMQPIVTSLLSFHWMQLVVQTIVCDAGVFLSRWKLPCLYSYPCGHPCTMLHIGILWLAGIEGRGKKTGEGGKNSPILLARFDFPQLFDVFLNMAVTRAERFGHSKKTHENVNFDLFLC